MGSSRVNNAGPLVNLCGPQFPRCWCEEKSLHYRDFVGIKWDSTHVIRRTFGLEVLSLIQEPETASRSKPPHGGSRQGQPDPLRPAFPSDTRGNMLEELRWASGQRPRRPPQSLPSSLCRLLHEERSLHLSVGLSTTPRQRELKAVLVRRQKPCDFTRGPGG